MAYINLHVCDPEVNRVTKVIVLSVLVLGPPPGARSLDGKLKLMDGPAQDPKTTTELPPGQQEQGPQPRPKRKRLRLFVGFGLVILGFLGGLVPIVQGWMLMIPGLIILSDYFPPVRRLLNWARRKAAGMRGRQRASEPEPPGQV